MKPNLKETMHEQVFWDNEEKVCTYLISYDNRDFYGIAKCHPEDEDMRSKHTGETIAFNRAYIKLLKYIIKVEIKKPLTVLINLYNNMATSHRFNEQSFEAIQMRKKIAEFEDMEAYLKALIKNVQEFNIDYITQKDSFYRTIRANREKQAKAENN